MAIRTIVQNGPISAAATWGGTFPGQADIAIQPSGLTNEIDVLDFAMKRFVYHGRLNWSRTVSTRLNLFGSLVSHHGIADIGLWNDRIPVGVQHEVVFDYAEAGAQLGNPPETHPDPALVTSLLYDTDAGWWFMHDGYFYAHGFLIRPWTELTADAAAAGNTCSVDGHFTEGWAAGYELVFAATDLPTLSSPWQQEYRTLGSLGGAVGDASRLLTLNGAETFAYAHQQWTKVRPADSWGFVRTELTRGEVACVTRNIIIRAARSTDRAHVMFMDSTRFYVDGVRFKDMGPKTRPNMGDIPVGRYAGLHAHKMYGNIAPGNHKTDPYYRRCVFDGDMAQERGWAASIHETDGIEFSENTIVGHGTSVASGSQHRGNGMALEDTTPQSEPGAIGGRDGIYRSAEDVRIFRNLYIRTGHKDTPGSDAAGLWTGRGQGPDSRSVMVDNHYSGHDGNDDTGAQSWTFTQNPEATGIRDDLVRRIPAWGITSHSNKTLGLRVRSNTQFRPVVPVTDVRLWRCRTGGIQHGAYASGWRDQGIRIWEWGPNTPALEHGTHSRLLSAFFIDGGNLSGGAGAAGIHAIAISSYVQSSALVEEDSIYELGVARNLDTWFSKYQSPAAEARSPSWIQFSRIDFGGFKILYGMASFVGGQGGIPYGTHPQEMFPPAHIVSLAVCGTGTENGYTVISIIRVRNGVPGSLPNTSDVSFDLRGAFDTLSPGSEPALPEDYGRSTRTSEIYPNAGSNAGAKKSNVGGTDKARELAPFVRWLTPGARYSQQPAAAGDGTRLQPLLFETNATVEVEIYERLSDWIIELIAIPKPTKPTAAPSGAAGAAGTPNGTYTIKYTNVFANSESEPSAASGSVVVTSQQINVSGVLAGPAGTLKRRVYAFKTGVSTSYQLVGEIADNVTTTFTITTEQGSWGVAAPNLWQGWFNTYDMALHPYGWAAFSAEATNSREAAVNITKTSTTVTAPAGTFSSADVGIRVMIEGGASGGKRLTTTIATFVSSSQVTLAAAAGQTKTGAEMIINAHPTGSERRISTEGEDVQYVYKELTAGTQQVLPVVMLSIAD